MSNVHFKIRLTLKSCLSLKFLTALVITYAVESNRELLCSNLCRYNMSRPNRCPAVHIYIPVVHMKGSLDKQSYTVVTLRLSSYIGENCILRLFSVNSVALNYRGV